MVNQAQVENLVKLQEQVKNAEVAFMSALNDAGYKVVWTGSYEDTRRYMVHPSFAQEAEANTDFIGIKQEWLDSLPPGIVFEP